ncbi:hypothetical protein [Paenibacillus flagellatus]|uniref:Uncharacterized protein n=1 Tax=Paenibacillus flagellatus TaxID=2211139 RepID=A0A2V5JVS5_9BACL|nr:hypothetical protein [Paenibacillus flagellatus]PYI50819.1 hypothetical protein DLM86_27505 [Paenibacillus flagellatus]
MIPFENTLPYETIGRDVYLVECPYCGERNVHLALKTNDLQPIREGRKKLIVFPCCREKITAVDADRDYLLADRIVRRR